MHPRHIIYSSPDDDKESRAHCPDTSNRPPLAEIRRNNRLNAPEVYQDTLEVPAVKPTEKRKAFDGVEPKSTKIAKLEGRELGDIEPADEQNDKAEEDEEEQLNFVLTSGDLSHAEKSAILNALESSVPDIQYESFFEDDEHDDEEEGLDDLDRYGTPSIYTNAADPLTESFINPNEAARKECITYVYPYI